jgi:pyrophosphatase PpaX
MIKAVLFDYDGTLVNTNDIICYSLHKTCTEVLNRELTDEEFFNMFGRVLEDQMNYLCADKEEELCKRYLEIYWGKQDELVHPFNNLIEMLKQLKERGIKTGIVSSKTMDGIERGLLDFGFAQYIDAVVSSDDTDVHKPSPIPLYIGAKKLGVEPDQTIFVGDSPYDIEASNVAGMVAVLTDYTIFPTSKFSDIKIDFRVSDLIEVLDILDK